MIDQILIIHDSGVPIFSWSPNDASSDADLISGFLTALNMFAQQERGESIKRLTLDPTNYFFEREENLIFVVLTSDLEVEPLIKLILPEMRHRFMDQYRDTIHDFQGDLSQYSSFKSILEQLLAEYGLFEYLRVNSENEPNTAFRCLLFFDKNTGTSLYQKTREYIDRKQIGFLSTVLLKAAERIFNEVLEENLKFILIITETGRYISFKSTPSIILIQERKYTPDNHFYPSHINEGKFKSAIKKPGKLLLGNDYHFALLDSNGKKVLINDTDQCLKTELVSSHLITASKNASNLVQQIYKDQLFTLMAITDKKIYSIFMINGNVALFQFSAEQHARIYPNITNPSTGDITLEIEKTQIDEIIAPLDKFLALFN